MKQTIILATGGTGGHIFPARTIAEKLSEKGFEVIIFGDSNYSRYHKKDDAFSFKIISSSQITKSLRIIKSAIKISFGIFQSLFFIIKSNPNKIVCFGGYATFPTLIAAIILGKKIILHEQNAHLGKVNRLFARFADKIALSFEETDGIAKNVKNKTKFTGNPVRKEILKLSHLKYQLPSKAQIILSDNLGYDIILTSEFYKKSLEQEKFNILIIGGSGGAKIFSEILPQAFFNLKKEIKTQFHITQQCRTDSVGLTSDQYKFFKVDANVSHFFENMAEEISKAHLIIARSGSTSIAEFSCSKKPMILVPFAKSADNHQEKNANAVMKKGGAIVIKEQDFTVNKVVEVLRKLINNEDQLQEMSKNAFDFANLKANENLTKLIQDS